MNDWISELVHFLDTADAAAWLNEENADLGGRTPLDAVRDGDQDAVADSVRTLTE